MLEIPELHQAFIGKRPHQVVHVRGLPSRKGHTVEWPDWADEDLIAGYQANGVDRPWKHQVDAAQALWDRHHTVIATGTGSGKSLAFWLPALTLARAAGGSVLYLAPTKALGSDQIVGLNRVITSAGIRDLQVMTCDGDTSPEIRQLARSHGDVVATNPDFLHFSLLPGHRRWARFLSKLADVVIDESHAFHGVFGAHVAMALRRLRRVASIYGANPTFALASATTSDPARSASDLVGVSAVTAVSDDYSPAGSRTVIFLRSQAAPDVTLVSASQSTEAVSSIEQTASALADLVKDGAQVLAFTRSRKGAELVAESARGLLTPDQPVLAYRGGYLPEERRALEDGLRITSPMQISLPQRFLAGSMRSNTSCMGSCLYSHPAAVATLMDSRERSPTPVI